MSFFDELKRRNVFRVAVVYGISAWLLLQVADLVFDLLQVPDWTLRFIFGLLIAAFPFVLFFTWAFEITPDGIKREAEVDHSEAALAVTRRKADRLIIVLLVAVVAFVALDRLLFQAAPPGATQTAAVDSAPAPTGQVPASEQPDYSIAVLPFVNMSRDEDNEYFSDGLSETLLNLLTRIPDLQVAARTSSFKFKGMNEDMRLIGEQLNVAHLLEGSVQRSGDRVRITAQLIKVADGYHLWSQTYDRTLDDVFAVQDEIAAAVADALELTLLGAAPKTKVVATDVFDDFLRAQTLLARRSTEDVTRAIALLQSVVERQPDFALAHARLAVAWLQDSYSGALLEDIVPKAEAAARRAVELDASLADGHAALGWTALVRLRSEEALAHLETALALAPNDANTLMSYASVLARLGRIDEALASARDAQRLDPLNPDAIDVTATVLTRGGRYAEGIELLEQALQAWPRNLDLLDDLADAYETSGRYAQAFATRAEITGIDPQNFHNWQGQFEMYMDLGVLDHASEALGRMRELAPERAYDEVARYELLKGNAAGYREYLRKYSEARTWSREIAQVKLAVSEQRYDEALGNMIAPEQDGQYDYVFYRLTATAAVANLAGNEAAGKEALAQAGEKLVSLRARMFDKGVVSFLEASLAAASGNAETAVLSARTALAAGFRDFDSLVSGDDLRWLPIRQTPEFAALVDDIQKANEATWAEVLAARAQQANP